MSKKTRAQIFFLKSILNSPGCKHAAETSYQDDNGDYQELWSELEKLELVECIGSYKWIPTEKLKRATDNAVNSAILILLKND